MASDPIRLARPNISEEAIQKVNEVLRSGNLVQGEYVEKFELALAGYLGCKHVVVVSSGTAALHLALISAGIGSGDEVIVPAFTFPATANVVELVGAKPVLVDITLDDFCIDTAQIEAAITSRTKAIMPVHEFGQAADMKSIMGIAQSHNLMVIEDAACALGTEYDGKKAGTFGKMGCFSFHPRKAITTGEGGAIITNDADIANKLKSLRNHGMVKHDGNINFEYAGFNYRMTDFQAVLGIDQLQNFDESIEARQLQAKMLDAAFENHPQITTPKVFINRRHTYQTYHVLINSRIDRDLVKNKFREKNIESNYGAYALHMLSFYKRKYKSEENKFPNALNAYLHGLALPLGGHVDKYQLNKLSDAIINVIDD